jgi:hypothetical protein
VLHWSVGVLLYCREGGGGGRELRAAAVIGAFVAAITGSEGGGERWRSAGTMRRKKAGWPRGPGGRMGRLAAGPNGSKVKKNSFPNKNLIFDYSKALEICRRGFRRNFDMRIFPKFF